MKHANHDECDGPAGLSPSAPAIPERNWHWRSLFRCCLECVFRWGAERLLSVRVWLLGFGHLVLFLTAYWLAFLLRFGFVVPAETMTVFWLSVPWVLGAKLVIFCVSGHYHGWWRHVTFSDLAALLRACLLSLLTLAALDHFVLAYQIPRAILLLDCIIAIVLLGGLRSSWRLFEECSLPLLNSRTYRRALLVGADHNSAHLAHQIHCHPELQYRVRGFLAVNGEKRRTRLGQIPVLGPVQEVGKIAAACRVSDVLVTAGTLPGPRLRTLMETCDEVDLDLKIIPPASAMFDGDRRIPIRDVQIDDLLHRDPVKLDTQVIEDLIEGAAVMVTGAGGSIGSEICRQVMQFRPHSLVLVGRGENRIFHIERELKARGTFTELCSCIGDVTDAKRMHQLFEVHRPDVVFHAAAHKHVPLMESNVGEAIKNNVGGTRRVADLAHEFGVACFVLISTDKAVNPTSVMGATKQVAETYVHALSQQSATRFVVTRFGNVLGSAGSVVPIFQEQIRHGGPITVTDARMARYFMSIPEASQLVLQAAAMGRGGEIFVLDMGQPIRIVDLARDLTRLSGLPEGGIDVQFTGIRPGEKLFEELYFDDEHTLPTTHPKLRAARHRPCSLSEIRRQIASLEQLGDAPEEAIRKRLQEIVPEYHAPMPAVAEVEVNAPQRLCDAPELPSGRQSDEEQIMKPS